MIKNLFPSNFFFPSASCLLPSALPSPKSKYSTGLDIKYKPKYNSLKKAINSITTLELLKDALYSRNPGCNGQELVSYYGKTINGSPVVIPVVRCELKIHHIKATKEQFPKLGDDPEAAVHGLVATIVGEYQWQDFQYSGGSQMTVSKQTEPRRTLNFYHWQGDQEES